MYATRAVNGTPAIQRDGQIVLSVCDQDWEFADWLCALLNELGHMENDQQNRSEQWMRPEEDNTSRLVTRLLRPRHDPFFLREPRLGTWDIQKRELSTNSSPRSTRQEVASSKACLTMRFIESSGTN